MSTATIGRIDTTTLSYDLLNSGRTGAYCTFVKIGSRGLKTYKSENERDRHYQHQLDLSLASLAPETFGTIDCMLHDGSMRYAYWTECAECADDVHNDEWVERKDCAVLAELQDRLEEFGYPWNDDHSGNWGYVDDRKRAVIIDTPGY